MKKALTLLLAVAFSGLASAVTYDWTELTLPTSSTRQDMPNGYGNPHTAPYLVQGLKGKDAGVVYVGGVQNAISNWGQNGEGTWAVSGNVGTATLAYRGGVVGDYAALVLGGMKADMGTDALKYTFSVNANTKSSNLGFTTAVGIVRNGEVLATADGLANTADGSALNASFTVPAGAALGTQTVELSLKELFGDDFTWQDDDKLIVVFRGMSSSINPTETYNVENITVSLGAEPAPVTPEFPEPTVLALLALGVAGLALRRKVC